jgi:hypothetical protein
MSIIQKNSKHNSHFFSKVTKIVYLWRRSGARSASEKLVAARWIRASSSPSSCSSTPPVSHVETSWTTSLRATWYIFYLIFRINLWTITLRMCSWTKSTNCSCRTCATRCSGSTRKFRRPTRHLLTR